MQVIGVLCDKRVPIKPKGKICRTVVRQPLVYGTECWSGKMSQEHQTQVAEMCMLWYISGVSQKDRIMNDYIRRLLGVADIKSNMREHRLW